MATTKGKIQSEEYNNEPVIKGKVRVWFLNGDLVRVHHRSRSTGMVTFYNITKDRLETCMLSDFKKNKERAYSVAETAVLVNRHRKYIPTLIKQGKIPAPVGAQLNGERHWQVRAYYSESQVREIRAILASIQGEWETVYLHIQEQKMEDIFQFGQRVFKTEMGGEWKTIQLR